MYWPEHLASRTHWLGKAPRSLSGAGQSASAIGSEGGRIFQLCAVFVLRGWLVPEQATRKE